MNDDPASVPSESASSLPSVPNLAAEPIAASTNLAPSRDPFTEEVLLHLNQRKQRSWLQTILVLGFSLVLFGMAGMFDYGPVDLGLLIAVLLFHEGGHYLGMRLFGYQDVQMFFIPFIGAAVSGRNTNVAGYKEAIVILLGPLPGIVLGMIVGIAAWIADTAFGRSAATMLLVINGFNLLPFLPLDGGRLLNLALFSRQRHLEAVFRCLTGTLLAIAGFLMGAWILGIVGVMMLFSTGSAFRIRSLSQELRSAIGPALENESGDIPRGQAEPIIDRVRQSFPQLKAPKAIANVSRQVWDQLRMNPPGWLATAALLVVHGGGFFGCLVAFGLFHFPFRTIEVRHDAQGRPVQHEVIRVWGRLQESPEDRAEPEDPANVPDAQPTK